MSIPKGLCTFDGCEKYVRQLGLCSGHYSQLKRGTELKPLRPRFGMVRMAAHLVRALRDPPEN
jgi:hypothetical protein